MPRTIQIHPLSLLVGVGCALLGIAAMGQMSVATKPLSQHHATNSQVAHPREWVVIRESSPYIVPLGKTLVITAFGAACPHGATNSFSSSVMIDGVGEVGAVFLPDSSVVSVATGLAASAGQTVDVIAPDPSMVVDGRAWGYLVPSNGVGYERLTIPGPAAWVVIKPGAGYVVPAGKILVVSAAGSASGLGNLSIDGVVEHSSGSQPLATVNYMPELPVGLKAAAGQLVEVFSPNGPTPYARAWGYLVDA